MTGQKIPDPYYDLDWTTLENWAGARTLSRGRQYQREGRVHGLSLTPDWTLVAWVDGLERYATAVTFDKRLTSVCTCPVGSVCKHAVAVILEYLAVCKKNASVGILPADDPRLSLLGIGPELSTTADPGTIRVSQRLDPGRNVPSALTKSNRKPDSLHQFLEKLSKEELIGLLDDLIRVYPSVKQDITDRKYVAGADAGPVIRAFLSDIERVTAEDAGDKTWNGQPGITDYTPIRKRMEILISMGHPDDVVRGGRILLEKGVTRIGWSDDDGGTEEGIAACLDIVFEALAESALSASERMLFAILADLNDEYDLCAGAERFLKEKIPVPDWGHVADTLVAWLDGERYNPERGRRSGSRYDRDKLTDWIMTALDRAGREDEATSLCIAEVDCTASYTRLVRRLLRLGRGTEARNWIARGIARTEPTLPGIADNLRTIQRELWEKDCDWLLVAGLRAEEFLKGPSFLTYRRLEKSAQAAGVWDDMQGTVRQYLETGKLPGRRRGDREEGGKLFGILPDPGLFPREPGRAPESPFYSILIDIAIAMKQPDEVIVWYDKMRAMSRTRGFLYYPEDKVAGFIAEEFPDRAIAIWMEKAEKAVDESRPKSYEASVGYLKKIRDLMKKHGRDEEWERYIEKIRTRNVRKIRFLGMLDILEGTKILKQD